MKKKVIIIGAGAAGLAAAAAAAEKGHSVTIVEKNEKAGKKIYITGKGRCNLTNDCATEDFFSHVARNPRFLYSSVYSFDHDMVKDFLEKNGCPVKVERGGRVFPVSDHASDVTAAFLRRLNRLGVRILYETEAAEILVGQIEEGSGPKDREEKQTAFQDGRDRLLKGAKKAQRPDRCIRGVRLGDGRVLKADAVILCTGGLSYPSTGSTGDGLRMAGSLGLAVTDTAPSLVPFEVEEKWCRDLQGLALKNVSVRLFPYEQDLSAHPEKKTGAGSGADRPGAGKKRKKPVYAMFGELLFTHFGLSGPIILTASCYCDFQKCPQGYELHLDLKPALSEEQLSRRILREFEAAPNRHLAGALRPLFPARLAETVADLSGRDLNRRAASFGEREIRELASLIKDLKIHVTGTRGYAEAIVTRGGISVKEINPSTMESRKISGLFAAGEVLDVDAQTGGFNLQIAWSTGHLAGSSVQEETGL